MFCFSLQIFHRHSYGWWLDNSDIRNERLLPDWIMVHAGFSSVRLNSHTIIANNVSVSCPDFARTQKTWKPVIKNFFKTLQMPTLNYYYYFYIIVGDHTTTLYHNYTDNSPLCGTRNIYMYRWTYKNYGNKEGMKKTQGGHPKSIQWHTCNITP